MVVASTATCLVVAQKLGLAVAKYKSSAANLSPRFVDPRYGQPNTQPNTQPNPQPNPLPNPQSNPQSNPPEPQFTPHGYPMPEPDPDIAKAKAVSDQDQINDLARRSQNPTQADQQTFTQR
jgi:hypothetical protein